MFEIIRYTPDKADEWNQFIAKSKNGTFLFDRNYMDYHSDRFHDYSLLFYREGKLFGLLPANIQEDTLHSHQGLTYGGLIMSEKTIAEHVQQLFRELNEWLKIKGIKKVVYKPVPHIFHSIPAEEDLFSLYSICDAQIIDRSLSTAIDLIRPLAWHRDRKYGINRSAKNGVTIEESNNWSSFWQILSENLMEKYGAHPVHTLQEIELLHSRFPQQIKLFTACRENEILGGTVIYLTPQVAHTQYISANKEGKHLRVIDALFHELFQHYQWDCHYFNFGTSNGEDGHILVEPLIHQKEGFGGRGICYDTYEWEP